MRMNQATQTMTSVPLTTESDPLQMKTVFDSQQETALRWRESTAAERIARIKKLRDAMMAQREAFYDAFMQDYRKSPAEVEASEFLPVMDEMRHAIGRVRRWMKPHKVWPTSTMIGTSGAVHYQPRGRVLRPPRVRARRRQHRDHQAVRNDTGCVGTHAPYHCRRFSDLGSGAVRGGAPHLAGTA